MRDGGRLVLRILSGKRAGEEVEVRPPGGTVGRDEDCVLILPETTVSRRHAELMWDGRGWWVEDAGSHNGTFLDQERLGPRPAPLKQRGALAFGETEIAYRAEQVEPAASLDRAAAPVSETQVPRDPEALTSPPAGRAAVAREGEGAPATDGKSADGMIQALQAEHVALEQKIAELQAALSAQRPAPAAAAPSPGEPAVASGIAALVERIAMLLDEFGTTLEAVLAELQRAGGGPTRVRELVREACVRLADVRSFLDTYRTSS
jgi:pSer/pThr/pTyr-binding forkhead associated (FHA) protein